jgi:hypothetical protein
MHYDEAGRADKMRDDSEQADRGFGTSVRRLFDKAFRWRCPPGLNIQARILL